MNDFSNHEYLCSQEYFLYLLVFNSLPLNISYQWKVCGCKFLHHIAIWWRVSTFADYIIFHRSIRRATMDKTAIALEAISRGIVDLVLIFTFVCYYVAFPGNIMLCIKLQNWCWVLFICATAIWSLHKHLHFSWYHYKDIVVFIYAFTEWLFIKSHSPPSVNHDPTLVR